LYGNVTITLIYAVISTRESFIFEIDETGLREVSTTIVPEGVQFSTEVEENRHRAHAHAHQVEKKKSKVLNHN
jgi:alkaline phosphatase D